MLDREMDAPVIAEIREVVASASERQETRLVDLHVWRAGKHSYSCALSTLTRDATSTARRIRKQLSVHEDTVHSTIEVNFLHVSANE